MTVCYGPSTWGIIISALIALIIPIIIIYILDKKWKIKSRFFFSLTSAIIFTVLFGVILFYLPRFFTPVCV